MRMDDHSNQPVHYRLLGSPASSGGLTWMIVADNSHATVLWDTVTISVSARRNDSERKALKWLAEKLAAQKDDWLKPAASPRGKWIIDLGRIREFLKPQNGRLTSWKGSVLVLPHFRFRQEFEERLINSPSSREEWTIEFEYPQSDDEDDWQMASPMELQPYLEAFRMDHPNSSKTGFVMMRFKDTPLQLKAFHVVQDACAKLGITALRANSKHYSEDLFPNIRTYMHGCGFGISIFERITEEDFNPNVSLEVGYMLGLGKPVLLLKDHTLHQLQSDLVGRLYESFDTQRTNETIPAVIEKWLRGKGILV